MTRQQEERIALLEGALDASDTRCRELAVVVDSLREIVSLGWRHRDEPCPFCKHVDRHGPLCYLSTHAGAEILAEYTEIERQRDELLARLKAFTGEDQTPNKRSLKARLRTSWARAQVSKG